jgi:succinoglycan biosynthesis protein ExoH
LSLLRVERTALRTTLSPSLRHRIDALRTGLVLAIVLLHAMPVAELTAPHDLTSLLGTLLQNGPARAAVPLFSAISGYLLFSSGLDVTPRLLLRKKARSLLVPLVVWNLPLALLVLIAQARGDLAEQRLDLLGGGARVWCDGVLAFGSSPINYPLHFVRDLFVLALSATVAGPWLRRAPLATLLAVHVAFGVFNMDGWLLLRTDMPTLFFAGGALAVVGADLTRLDAQWRQLLLVFAFAVVAHVLHASPATLEWVRLIGVVSVWAASGRLASTRVGTLMASQAGCSFWIFASHAPLLEAFYRLWGARAESVPDHLFWLFGPLAAVATGLLSFRACSWLTPRWTAVACGATLRNASHTARRTLGELVAAPVPSARQD